jgi:hypothetical protein
MKWALFTIALSGAGSGLAEQASRFEVKQLQVDGDVLNIVAEDLDGDGRKDLLVNFKRGLTPNETRHFAVFWNQGKTFSAKPDLVVPVDADACTFDVASIDGQPGAQVLTMTPKGVYARSLRGRSWGAATAVVGGPTLCYQPERADLPRLRLVQDVAAEGSGDLLVPSLGAVSVYRRNGGAFSPAGRVEVHMDSSLSFSSHGSKQPGMPSIHVQHRFPRLNVADTDGDGRRDIIVSHEDRVDIFQQHADGSFEGPAGFQRNFGIRLADEIKDAHSDVGVSVNDIDGDGIADLVIRKQIAHGLASFVNTTYVFFGRKGGGYAEKADQVMKTEGASGSEVDLLDLTGDGHPDLISPSVNIGILAIIRILTTKTLKIKYQVFPFVPATRRFADEPIAEREIKLTLNLSGESDTQAADYEGDYNGDRRRDLVFGTGDNELSIFPGIVGSGLFADDAVETIAVRAFGEAMSVDLDRKGKSDIVLYYPSTKDHRGDIEVLFNRGPW